MKGHLQEAMPDVPLHELREQREIHGNHEIESNDEQEERYENPEIEPGDEQEQIEENNEVDEDEYSDNDQDIDEDGAARFYEENNATIQFKTDESNDIVPLINS